MAELFLARAPGIEGFSKNVALKRILPARADNERFVRMFLAEARLVAGLDHPNIAQVYDIGQHDGEYFFTMEYVDGLDLSRILAAAPDRRLTIEHALHIAIGTCAGLHHAHEATDEHGRSLGIVHRDVSPSNVLVSYEGTVKLVDFGVAKTTALRAETCDGIVKGKFGYLSPEQCCADPLTRRSDVFNVGILLWEMTVGRYLYSHAGDYQSLQQVVDLDAPPPSRFLPDYPPELEAIVMRALSRDPERRYRTAQELQLDLERFALEHRILVSPVSMAQQMRSLRDRVEVVESLDASLEELLDDLELESVWSGVITEPEPSEVRIDDDLDPEDTVVERELEGLDSPDDAITAVRAIEEIKLSSRRTRPARSLRSSAAELAA